MDQSECARSAVFRVLKEVNRTIIRTKRKRGLELLLLHC